MSIAYKENGVWKTVSGIPPVDGALSSTSENPVQNKIVKQAVDGKSNTGHNHDERYYTETEVDTKLAKTETLISNSSDAYNPTKSYKLGDLCIYNNVLYRCITACSAGSWETNQSCFTQDTLVNAVDSLSGKLRPQVLVNSQSYTTNTSLHYTGTSFTPSEKCLCLVSASYYSTGIYTLAVGTDSTNVSYIKNVTESSIISAKDLVIMCEANTTYYVWTKDANANLSNRISVNKLIKF